MNPFELMGRALRGGGTAAHKPPARNPAPPEVIKTYPEAERIAASLLDFPGDWGWAQKGYTLEHKPTGFTLWVANGKSCLGERSNGTNADFEEPERKIIWPAVEAWRASHRLGFTGRLPKVKITGRNGTWWCVAESHPWAGAGGSPVEAYRSWARAVSIEARTDKRPGEILHVWSAAQ